MQLSDLARVDLVSSQSVGLKSDGKMVKLLFKNGRREEECVLSQPLFSHAMGVPDEEMDSLFQDNHITEKARTCAQLGKVLERMFKE